MPTLKHSDSATTVVFADGKYVDKLLARNVRLDDSNPPAITLTVEFQHYAGQKRNDLEDTDFEQLQLNSGQISRLILRDTTISEKIEKYAEANIVIVEVNSNLRIPMTVKKQTCDRRQVAFDF